MKNSLKQNNISRYIRIDDYKEFDYEIPDIFLDFVIKKNSVNITTKLQLIKKNKFTKSLILDGTDIFIKTIHIDDSLLKKEKYVQQKNKLVIKTLGGNNLCAC